MLKSEEQSRTRAIAAGISGFIRRNRIVFLVILIILAVGLVGFVVGTEIMRGRINESTRLAEDLQESYQEWQIAEDEAEKTELAGEIIASANAIVSTYPRLYASQRALFVKGQFQFERELYVEAAETYLDLADRFPDSHLASVSLFNAAVAFEEAGEPARAAEAYERIVTEQGSRAPETPHALISLGRLAESESRYTRAADFYGQLEEEYPASSWTNLARARIISLTAQGLVAE